MEYQYKVVTKSRGELLYQFNTPTPYPISIDDAVVFEEKHKHTGYWTVRDVQHCLRDKFVCIVVE